jgi:deoxycytidylate deaminase
MNKFIEAARAVALLSPGVGANNNFRLGCVLVNKNMVVSSGFNSYKTHPALYYLTKYPYLHAEQAAILKRGLDNCKGLDMYVVRILKDGTLATSKPCKVCASMIKDVGIRRVVWT